VRVALVHDWLTGFRGGEKCLHELACLYPQADLYTLVHAPGSASPEIEALPIRQSPLGRLPGAARHYRLALPLFPWAIRHFYLSGYDLVISSSHAVAKGIRLEPRTPHLCYCHTPMRYVWDQADAYLGRGLRRALASSIIHALQRFDVRTSGPDQVTRFVANSRAVALRIQRHYGREAAVVPPPVDVKSIQPDGKAPDDFYLLVGGFVPYKREDIALAAFRGSGRRLVVVGDGPGRAALQAGAPAEAEFLGRVPDGELHALYGRCRALIHPQEEDFGIAAVEAQAAGRPVIALGRGGARDTVIPLAEGVGSPPPATGLWFAEQKPQALRDAIVQFEEQEAAFDASCIRQHAEAFSAERFRASIQAQVQATLEG